MEISTLLIWVAVGAQIVAQGAPMIWPQQKWPGWVCVFSGFAVAAIATYLFLSSHGLADLKHAWFVFPLGLSTGLTTAWLWFRPYRLVPMQRHNQFAAVTKDAFSFLLPRNVSKVFLSGLNQPQPFIDLSFLIDNVSGLLVEIQDVKGNIYINGESCALSPHLFPNQPVLIGYGLGGLTIHQLLLHPHAERLLKVLTDSGDPIRLGFHELKFVGNVKIDNQPVPIEILSISATSGLELQASIRRPVDFTSEESQRLIRQQACFISFTQYDTYGASQI
jgi:hypothetical protein